MNFFCLSKKKIISGYKIHLNNKLYLNFFTILKKIFLNSSLNFNEHVSSRLKKYLNINYDLIFKERLAQIINSKKYNEKYFHSLSDNSFYIMPIPKKISKEFDLKYFKLSIFFSSFSFCIYLLFQLLFGFVKALKIIFLENNKKNFFPMKKHVFFIGLKKYFLPLCEPSNDYSLLTWFIKNEFYNKKYLQIRHQVSDYNNKFFLEKEIFFSSSIIPPIDSYRKKFYFLLKICFEILISFLNIFQGKWMSAFLFVELIDVIKIKYINQDYLAEKYFFSSSANKKPLWAFAVEKLKKDVIYYNYASSFPGFKYNNDYFLDLDNLLSSWKIEYQWSPHLVNYLKSLNKDFVHYKLVSPIYGTDSEFNINLNNRNFRLSVFDMTPPKNYHSYVNFITNFNYHTSNNVILFLNNIVKVCIDLKIEILWKQRWDTDKYIYHKNNSIHCNRYKIFCKNIMNDSKIIKAHSYVSPYKLIINSNASVSIPFTSTAIWAKNLNKPSVYYDPTSILDKNDRACQGIELISSIDSLVIWLEMLIKKNK